MRGMLAEAPADLAVLDAAPAPAPRSAPAAPPVRWRLATRIAFRLSFLYFSLYVLTTQMLNGIVNLPLPDLGATGYMKPVVVYTATSVFRVSRPYLTTATGSGDRTVDWIQAFVLLAAAAAGTVLWSVLDRRRASYAGMHKWFHLSLRFAVGATMVSYGMVKAMPLQMPYPSLQRLVEPFGNFSPMGVLWYSIGASPAYERFAGFMELAGGVLLFIPQLSLVGALITMADSVQIFTLNMTYDVPVKLFSFHLLLMSLALVAPEARRLIRVLVLNRTAEPSTQPPLFRGTRARRIAVGLQLAFGAYIVGMNVYEANQSWSRFGAGAPKSPLYGIWNVEEMKVDGVVRSALVGDHGRWRRLIFQNPASMSFQRMDDTFVGYGVKIDDGVKQLTVDSAPDVPFAAFAIERPGPDRLILDGNMDGHQVRFDMRLQPREKFLLVSRGFNWIQERPFNR
ncbi:MAG TPA: hypothetical protein VFK57_21220 [Vicinamibacterales bacterium]|nr:hypothetical protein [Vicinamibacterales bacterium]